MLYLDRDDPNFKKMLLHYRSDSYIQSNIKNNILVNTQGYTYQHET